MELPAEVFIHNELLGLKGHVGTLVRVADGYYEVNCTFGEKLHRTFLPIESTVLISREPEESSRLEPEVER
ncbi:MAG TPA: hypothetical protein VN783_04455 [Thermoanaerobaculia bacterium]|nr:hypothetical protein [Thermoanaerobaculia bacterium]